MTNCGSYSWKEDKEKITVLYTPNSNFYSVYRKEIEIVAKGRLIRLFAQTVKDYFQREFILSLVLFREPVHVVGEQTADLLTITLKKLPNDNWGELLELDENIAGWIRTSVGGYDFITSNRWYETANLSNLYGSNTQVISEHLNLLTKTAEVLENPDAAIFFTGERVETDGKKDVFADFLSICKRLGYKFSVLEEEELDELYSTEGSRHLGSLPQSVYGLALENMIRCWLIGFENAEGVLQPKVNDSFQAKVEEFWLDFQKKTAQDKIIKKFEDMGLLDSNETETEYIGPIRRLELWLAAVSPKQAPETSVVVAEPQKPLTELTAKKENDLENPDSSSASIPIVVGSSSVSNLQVARRLCVLSMRVAFTFLLELGSCLLGNSFFIVGGCASCLACCVLPPVFLAFPTLVYVYFFAYSVLSIPLLLLFCDRFFKVMKPENLAFSWTEVGRRVFDTHMPAVISFLIQGTLLYVLWGALPSLDDGAFCDQDMWLEFAILAIFYANLVTSLSDIMLELRLISSPRAVITRKDKAGKSTSLVVKLAFNIWVYLRLLVIVLAEFTIWLSVAIVGTKYILTASSASDLIQAAVAVTFINDVDNYFYEAYIPEESKAEMEEFQLEYTVSREGKVKGPIAENSEPKLFDDAWKRRLKRLSVNKLLSISSMFANVFVGPFIAVIPILATVLTLKRDYCS